MTGRRTAGPSRRTFLQVGVIGGLGLTLDSFLRLKAARADQKTFDSVEGKARSVIQIFLPGGLAHQDSFDPKPYAPIEYRGDTATIATSIDGVQFSSLLPQTAVIANRIVVCRAMSHNEAAHERGTHNVFTGYRPSPALVYPSFGSVVSHEFGPRKDLPPYVAIPGPPTPYAGSGYLSSAHAPFSLGADPAEKGFVVRDLELPGGVDAARFARRRKMLDAVNEYFQAREAADDISAMDTFYQRAYELLGSPEARAAFDLEAEPAPLRDEYGRNPAGQRFLMARRLVEAGVRLVTVHYGGWDHHANIKDGLANQLPAFDQAFAALVRDLDARGLLDSTLVLVTTEFGRTPKVNPTAGRDHWPKVFSVVMAGGGLKRGYVHGASDATATEPQDGLLTIEDWATTVYHLIGIVADKELVAPGDRPIEIVKDGNVVRELLA